MKILGLRIFINIMSTYRESNLVINYIEFYIKLQIRQNKSRVDVIVYLKEQSTKYDISVIEILETINNIEINTYLLTEQEQYPFREKQLKKVICENKSYEKIFEYH